MTFTRRSMLATILATGAIPAFAKSTDAAADGVRALYRRAIVINGNLGGDFFEGARPSPEIAAQYRSSGLTALKSTLGGDSMDQGIHPAGAALLAR